MKLTKIQRHTAYILMLAEVECYEDNGWCCFMCHIFTDWVSRKIHSNERVLSRLLPELISKKPSENDRSGGWFNEFNYAIRKKLLQQCIKETY